MSAFEFISSDRTVGQGNRPSCHSLYWWKGIYFTYWGHKVFNISKHQI